VRDHQGHQLVVPSLEDLAALHAAGFLCDDDLVRRERGEDWVRAGDLPALNARRERRRDRRWLWSVLFAAALLVAALAMILAGR
jgi:hypothetical protein